MNNLKDKYKFLIKFFVLCILFNILFIPFKDGLINIVAYQSYFILNMFVEASYSGSIIYLPNTALEVIGACAGLELVAIYLALVFSISKNIKNILLKIKIDINYRFPASSTINNAQNSPQTLHAFSSAEGNSSLIFLGFSLSMDNSNCFSQS